ncbi:MAG: DUF5107 domain-containing protein, partial [Victivallaceae bacterium]|nr:DUF5107 domain-containing protein [Victivallaceae bacterium]
MTTKLYIENWNMSIADIGPCSPLPDLVEKADPHVNIGADTEIPDEIRRNMGYGRIAGMLPYASQNGYSRERYPGALKMAVLESEYLRAVFAMELGGRLWSLYDKTAGRELLHRNSVFQPANLAIRNAWFCGGVEWNIGAIGHCPFTCSPMFFSRVAGKDGAPVLRIYEWERIRQVAFQIDAWLDENAPLLYIRVRLFNSHDYHVPMYWWSNIAVPELPGTRVIVPAGSAYSFAYTGNLRQGGVPCCDGTDFSYPENNMQSADFFFNMANGERPWIAACGRDGYGLVQTSTSLLRGRKLFVWGMGRGGRK